MDSKTCDPQWVKDVTVEKDRRYVRLVRFRNRQQTTGRWVSLADAADWHARESGSIVADETKRATTYELFARAWRAGAFHPSSRSHVFYIDGENVPHRAPVHYLDEVASTGTDAVDTLRWCWVRREHYLSWCTANRVEPMIGPEHADAAPTGQPSAVSKSRKARGPVPGNVRRYAESDRNLFPTIEALIKGGRMSITAAARRLADDGEVEGNGTPESRAKRLADAFRKCQPR